MAEQPDYAPEAGWVRGWLESGLYSSSAVAQICAPVKSLHRRVLMHGVAGQLMLQDWEAYATNSRGELD